MGGNVSEWTATEFGPYPGTKATSRYWGKEAMRKLKIARGGSWRLIDVGHRPNEYKCGVSYRGKDYWPDKGYSFYGFRLAMDVPEKKK
jgi:formylglycine-generating enzyme required for sulfatase activity